MWNGRTGKSFGHGLSSSEGTDRHAADRRFGKYCQSKITRDVVIVRNCRTARTHRTLPILLACLSTLALLSSAHSGAAAQAAAADTCYERVVPSPDGIGKRYIGREIAGVMGWEGAQWLERESHCSLVAALGRSSQPIRMSAHGRLQRYCEVCFRPIVLKNSKGNNFRWTQIFNHFAILAWRRFWAVEPEMIFPGGQLPELSTKLGGSRTVDTAWSTRLLHRE